MFVKKFQLDYITNLFIYFYYIVIRDFQKQLKMKTIM